MKFKLNFQLSLNFLKSLKFWLILTAGFFFGGFIGFTLFKVQAFIVVSAFGVLLGLFVLLGFLIKENAKEMVILLGALVIIILISVYIGLLASMMSKFKGFEIKIDSWLSFYGTLFGSFVSVSAAVFLTQRQIRANKNLQEDSLNLENNNLKVLLNLLLKEEVKRNHEIFKDKYKKYKNSKGSLNLGKEHKFIISEWLLLKHNAVKLINDKECTALIINLIKLYNFIIEVNEKIDTYGTATYEGNEIGSFVCKLDTLFEDTLKTFKSIELIIS